MTARRLGVGLVLLGLALVGVGIYLKRAHGMMQAMVVLHTLATLGGLIPGVMLIVKKPRPR
ncbi:MAG: hypothetical protein L0216_14745 [Planctomycetales bacterium]|nr:hypothetical protein [Planctomycetales bacterium]